MSDLNNLHDEKVRASGIAMVTTPHDRFDSAEEAVEATKLALKAGNKTLVREAFEYFCGQLPPTVIVEEWTENLSYAAAFELWRLLHNYGLDEASDHENVRAVYGLLTDFIFTEAPPEIMAMFRKGFKIFFPKAAQMVPVGYSDNETAYYSVSQVCEVTGRGRGEVMKFLDSSREVLESSKDLHRVN